MTRESIEPSLEQRRVGVGAAVAQEGPIAANLLDAERIALGRRAAETMRSQIGATARTAGELQELLARP